MTKLTRKLNQWHQAGLIGADTMEAILTFERARGKNHLPIMLSGLAGFAILLGLSLIVAANWQGINDELKIGVHFLLNLGLIYAFVSVRDSTGWWRDVLLLLCWGSVLTLLALIGQTYHVAGTIGGLLLFWLILTTPMMLAFARQPYAVGGWFAVVIFTLLICRQEIWTPLWDLHLAYIVAAAIPWLFVTGGLFFSKRLPSVWSNYSVRLGALAIVFHALTVQITWRGFLDLINDISEWRIQVTGALLLTAILASVCVPRLIKLYDIQHRNMFKIVMIMAVLWPFIPLFIGGINAPLVGALMFCAFCFGLALLAHYESWRDMARAAIFLLAARFFIAYLELFGNMLLTGFGLIISGCLFLFLMYATPKIWKYIEGVRGGVRS